MSEAINEIIRLNFNGENKEWRNGKR
jgi:hypothetical protein